MIVRTPGVIFSASDLCTLVFTLLRCSPKGAIKVALYLFLRPLWLSQLAEITAGGHPASHPLHPFPSGTSPKSDLHIFPVFLWRFVGFFIENLFLTFNCDNVQTYTKGELVNCPSPNNSTGINTFFFLFFFFLQVYCWGWVTGL